MTWDMYEDAFEGGVLSGRIEGGRMGARVVCTATSVRAVGRDGTTFELPYHAITLERGGASGKMLFCRNADRTVTIFSEARGFFRELRENSRDLLAEQFERLDAGGRSRRRWVLISLVVVVALVVGAIFAVRPVVNWLVVTTVPYSLDETIGAAAFESMEKSGGLGGARVDNEKIDAALQVIIDRLRPYSRIKQAEFRLHVVDSPVINAYALPGGYMVVFTGLIEKASRPEEVAGVIAHEMSHVTLRHGMQRIVQSAGVVAGVSLLLGDVTGVAALVTQIFTLATINSYSRGSESEADAEGVRMMRAAGIDPNGLCEFFERLKNEAGGGGNVPDWLSTHPQHEDRIAAIRAQLAAAAPVDYEPLKIDWEEVKKSLR